MRDFIADAVNFERLIFKATASANEFQMFTEKGGSGTVRPLILSTSGNANQLVIKTDGNLNVANDLEFSANLALINNTDAVLFRNTQVNQRSNLMVCPNGAVGDVNGESLFQFHMLDFEADAVNYERLIFKANASANEFQMFTEKGGSGTVRPLVLSTFGNANQLIIKVDGNVSTTGELIAESGILTLKETTTPTATTNYAKIYSKDTNTSWWQDGAGGNHLLHGDSFSNIWFHNASTVEVTISTQSTFTIVDSFSVVGNEDDLANLIGSTSTNNLTLSSIGGGEYEISFHASITATGGADKEMILCLGITLATPKDITNVTDNLVTPIVITSVAHGLENGDMVEITGVVGNTAANGSFIVDSKANDTFAIVALDGSVTSGNGDFNEGSPTGDITIEYPGNMIVHREVRGSTLGAISATGLHILADSDVLAVYVANLDGVTNLTVAAISFDAFRIGD